MTNVTTLPRRIKAGPLPHVDERSLCRNDREAHEWLYQTHRVIHTATPPEREYEASAGEDALICGAAFLICAAAVVGAWLATH